MRARWAVLALVLGIVSSFPAHAKSKPRLPRTTALVCTVGAHGYEVADLERSVGVVGGPVAGRGWVDSEEAKGLLREGDRLSLYALGIGVLGQVVLTGKGELWSEGPQDGAVWGLWYDGKIALPASKRDAFVRANAPISSDSPWWSGESIGMLAAWTKDGRPPKWVSGKLLPSQLRKGSRYHRIAADWLRARGVPECSIEKLEVEQVVRADIEGDGRPEVFLSFHGVLGYPEYPPSMADVGPVPSSDVYSYLVMRRLRWRSKAVDTFVLDAEPWRTLWVAGFCDLDRDGCAEVVTYGHGIDYGGVHLHHSDGRRFRMTQGWGAGA